MSVIKVKINKIPNQILEHTNIIYYKSLPNVKDQCFILFKDKNVVRLGKQLNEPNTLESNCLYVSQQDRAYLNLSFLDTPVIELIEQPMYVKTIIFNIVDRKTNKKISNIEVTNVTKYLSGTVINQNDCYKFNINNVFVNMQILLLLDENDKEIMTGLVTDTTEYVNAHVDSQQIKLNITSINFQDIGVGGLEHEFMDLIKKIFLTRVIPETIYKNLGIKHTKGVILHGPPGCGKTRIAREIGRIIGCNNIRIINGPEILNKYVGESERNIRSYFEEAKLRPTEIFLLIFDEFDAIATKRNGSDHNNNSDKVVGQLLTMLDGVEEINNIIVFALTNRLDIIDPAILRPGRFSVQLKIGLPDTKGRFEILKIHTASLVKHNLLEDVELGNIAEKTTNFTGAELEFLVQTAIHDVLGNNIDFNNIVESSKKIDNLLIRHSDFTNAISKIKPMFQNKHNLHVLLSNKIKKELDEHQLKVVDNVIDRIRNSDKPLIFCIDGKTKSGKTTLVSSIGLKLMFDYTEYISASSMQELTDNGKVNYLINKINSPISGLIILDNLELIVEYISDIFFNKALVNIIKNLLNETNHHVIITTSYMERLKTLTVLDSVYYFEHI